MGGDYLKFHKQWLIRFLALILVFITIISPCLIAFSYKKQNAKVRMVEKEVKEAERQLPIYSVDTAGKKQVALTFDAAWGDEDAEKIREILNHYQVKVTFFMVGDWMRKYPDLVKELASDGHDIANHSDKHPHVNKMDKEDIKKDIQAAHQTIKELTGQECVLYRPPYGEYNNTVLQAAKECGYYTIQWDVDSIDWKGEEAPILIKRVTSHKKLKDGSIILLHNGAKHTAEALPQIIEGLKAKGYDIIPISSLIYKEHYYLDHEGRQHLEKQ